MSKFSDIEGLLEFLGGKRLMTFAEFATSSERGVVIVIGCYLGVDEGVDMWNDHQSKVDEPRYICYYP
jgi:hypothetical protein